MSYQGTITLTGASGNSYTFEVFDALPLPKFNKPTPCIYYVSRREHYSGTWWHSHLYVGKASDFNERFSSHHCQSDFEKHSYNCISVFVAPNEMNRTAIEDDLIRALAPVCNKKGNPLAGLQGLGYPGFGL